jgi:hypothetical protein
MPNKITIDYSGYAEKFGQLPGDGAMACWTFLIDGEPFVVCGSFAEACAKAKLYVRLYDAVNDTIALTDRAPHPRMQAQAAY